MTYRYQMPPIYGEPGWALVLQRSLQATFPFARVQVEVNLPWESPAHSLVVEIEKSAFPSVPALSGQTTHIIRAGWRYNTPDGLRDSVRCVLGKIADLVILNLDASGARCPGQETKPVTDYTKELQEAAEKIDAIEEEAKAAARALTEAQRTVDAIRAKRLNADKALNESVGENIQRRVFVLKSGRVLTVQFQGRHQGLASASIYVEEPNAR